MFPLGGSTEASRRPSRITNLLPVRGLQPGSQEEQKAHPFPLILKAS